MDSNKFCLCHFASPHTPTAHATLLNIMRMRCDFFLINCALNREQYKRNKCEVYVTGRRRRLRDFGSSDYNRNLAYKY